MRTNPMPGVAARPADDAPPTAPARWLWPAAAAYLLFPVYGSLLPFAWQAVGWDDALRQFADLLSDPLRIDSRADFAANVLLAVPLAVLWLAALLGGRGRSAAALEWAVAALVWLGCTALAFALEFSQIFFSGRSPALSDCVAQSIGAALGVLAWRCIPAGFWRGSRSSRAAWKQVQALYLGGLLLYALMPLDLTVSLSELSGKFTTGMVRLLPFSDFSGQPLLALTDALLDTALWAAAALLTLRAAGRLTAAAAIGLWLFAAGIECAQLLVLSRVVDTTDVITAALGIGLVAAFQSKFQSAQDRALPGGAATAWLKRAALPMALVLGGFLLRAYPFDFLTDTWALRQRLDAASAMPFASYTANGELYLVTNLLRRFFLFCAVGAAVQWTLAASALPARWHTLVALLTCAAAALGMEVMQLALPRGSFDTGDVLFAALCGAVAAAVARRLMPARGEVHGRPAAAAEPQEGRHRRSGRSRAASGQAVLTSALERLPPQRLRPFAVAGLVLLPMALAVAAYLPWTPYNVRELLTSGGLPWPVLPITLALLGLLGLPTAVAAKAGSSEPPQQSRRAGRTTAWLLGAPSVLALLLYAGVGIESVYDVVGTAVWGTWAAGEIWVRLAVLLLGVFWSLALGASLSGCAVARPQRVVATTRLLAHGLWVAPLWHALVVVFAGTDNLTELMAGGGGVASSLCLLAYVVLLGWIAGEGLKALASTSPRRWPRFLLRLAASAAAGYGLARLGTESTLVKYDQVFSALQFLLSADRGHYAGGAGLLLRFFLAQLLAVLATVSAALAVQGLASMRRQRRTRVVDFKSASVLPP